MTYPERGRQLGELVADKQAHYGRAYQKAAAILAILWPDGIRPGQYATAALVTRVCEKLARVSTQLPGDGESPWMDIAGISFLGWAMSEGDE